MYAKIKLSQIASKGGADIFLTSISEYINASERQAVDEFVGDSPQFDDLTMLGVKLI